MNLLRCKKGLGHIDTLVMLLAFVMLLMVLISVTQMIVLHQQVDILCDDLLETATVYGQFGSEFQKHLQAAQQDYVGLQAIVSESGHVQFGQTMQLTLTYSTDIHVFGDFRVPLTIRVTKYGLSERYWK